MASELKVNKITPESGVTLTLGDSGDTINFGSGVLPNFENLTVTGDLTVDTNSLKVDSTNNYVGIGTASPNKPLHIETTGETVTRMVGGTSSITGLYLGDSGNGSAGQVIYDNNGDYLRFNTSSTERVRITSAGNVGIGTTSPNSLLELKNTDGTTALELHRDFSGNVSGATNTARLDFTLSDTATSNQVIARISPQGSAGTGDAFAGNLRFFTANSSGTETERMRIDSSGNVGIGVVPETWYTTIDALQVGLGGSLAGNTTNPSRTYLGANAYINASNQETYIATDEASQYFQNAGTHIFKVASSGTAGTAISFTEAMKIDNSGNVGIGTTSPSDKLNIVNAGDVGVVIQNSNSGSATLSLLATGAGRVRSSGVIIFDTGGSTERMRIDSSGNVLVGKTTTDFGTAGSKFQSNGQAALTASANEPLVLNRLSSNGYAQIIYQDGTQIGALVTQPGTTMSIDGGNSSTQRSGIKFLENEIRPRKGINDSNNVVDLGNSSNKFNDGFFGGTVTANAFSGDGSALTGVGGGITEADQWRLTSSFSGDASPISSNLSRVNTDGFGYIGTGMSLSSGVFTFPSTGIWLIKAVARFTLNSDNSSKFNECKIETTTNNSTYDVASNLSQIINVPYNTGETNGYGEFLFDVTSTSTHKVRFSIDVSNGSTNTQGNSGQNLTYFTFIRLGDT